MKIFCILITLFFVAGCDKRTDPMDGFERLGGDKFAHFVFVEERRLGDRLRQRIAGQMICEKYNHLDYCEVYMWKDRRDVAEKLPIIKKETLIGLYTMKNRKIRLRTLR